jgi:exodeoxyribonuclease VII large subunit
MGNDLAQRLRVWRQQKSLDEKVELYMIMQNVTLEEIAEKKPKTKAEFIDIKGFGEKKYSKYGLEILSLINDEWEPISLFTPYESKDTSEREILTVSDFLDKVNATLKPIQVFVQGEITGYKIQKHLYFSLKDKRDESVLQCFMWEKDFEMAQIELQDGLEVILYGYPEIYKLSGKMTLRVASIELVGEGALKKAYDALKKKLDAEGCFNIARKKLLSAYPVRLGVITSKQGAVINDLYTNLGKFGYKIALYDSRVEGALAVRELVKAIRYFRSKPIDLLIVIRGGGSLESLQAFNNETLVKSILDYPVPVICGIGHDKDVPLFCLAADMSVSTPTAVAREINRTWENAIQRLDFYQTHLMSQFTKSIHRTREISEKTVNWSMVYYQKLKHTDSSLQNLISHFLGKISFTIKHCEKDLKISSDLLWKYFKSSLEAIGNKLTQFEKELQSNNPERQLKLGYSLLFSKNRIVKSVNQLQPNDPIQIQLSDGNVHAKAEEIIKKET